MQYYEEEKENNDDDKRQLTDYNIMEKKKTVFQRLKITADK